MKTDNTIHYIHPTGLAFALTAGVVYVVCAILVALWPQQSISFFGSWFHGVDLTKIAVAPQITIVSFVVGLISVIIFAYLVGALYAWAYNTCTDHCKRWGWI